MRSSVEIALVIAALPTLASAFCVSSAGISSLLPPLPLCRAVPSSASAASAQRRARAPRAAANGDGDDADTYAACIKMKVSELKSELDLRSISYEGLFEKEELARTLADARRSGKADPSLLDDFNVESMKKAWSADGPAAEAPEGADLADATAGDGGLPGGMTPEQLRQLTEDPERMAVLRNPKMQEVMRKVMAEGPQAAASMMDDPEVRELLSKFEGMKPPGS